MVHFEDYAETYALICDVIERTYHDLPLQDETGILHTSREARAAANRVLDILSVDVRQLFP